MHAGVGFLYDVNEWLHNGPHEEKLLARLSVERSMGVPV